MFPSRVAGYLWPDASLSTGTAYDVCVCVTGFRLQDAGLLFRFQSKCSRLGLPVTCCQTPVSLRFLAMKCTGWCYRIQVTRCMKGHLTPCGVHILCCRLPYLSQILFTPH